MKDREDFVERMSGLIIGASLVVCLSFVAVLIWAVVRVVLHFTG